ncbi:XdhC family protein [Nocardioides sp.]|uniref:XdhC family protein n=1 Tax=Nocardioides sp. TaxID=35761 RepID=UPI0039E265E4
MFDIALSVVSCLRAGTRVDVAWLVEADLGADVDLTEAVGLTPGGGRFGSLLGGVLDGPLADTAVTAGSGRRVNLVVDDLAATAAGLGRGGAVTCLVVPADRLPIELWQRLVDRDPVCLRTVLDGDEVVTVEVTEEPEAHDLLATGRSARLQRDGEVLTVLSPLPRLVMLGRGPIIDAVEQVATAVGWKVTRSGQPSQLTLLAQTLTPRDSVVVMSHDVEEACAVLGAALEGDAGYVGALGSRRMQQERATWLESEGYAGIDRIHGPAGLDIGAATPGEVAVSIVAEAIAAHAQAIA